MAVLSLEALVATRAHGANELVVANNAQFHNGLATTLIKSTLTQMDGRRQFTHTNQLVTGTLLEWYIGYSNNSLWSYGSEPNSRSFQDLTRSWCDATQHRVHYDAQNAVLQLEAAIKWDSLSIPFLAELERWRKKVLNSSWNELIACVQALDDACCNQPYCPVDQTAFHAAALQMDRLQKYPLVQWQPFSPTAHAAKRQEESSTVKTALLAALGESAGMTDAQELLKLVASLLPTDGFSGAAEVVPSRKGNPNIVWYKLNLDEEMVGTIGKNVGPTEGKGCVALTMTVTKTVPETVPTTLTATLTVALTLNPTLRTLQLTLTLTVTLHFTLTLTPTLALNRFVHLRLVWRHSHHIRRYTKVQVVMQH
jgi:hypothetical protein